MLRDQWQLWVGGFYLDVDEQHQGAIEIPFLGLAPFTVELSQETNWNYTVGTRYEFSRKFDATIELGFGDRDTALFNMTYRF